MLELFCLIFGTDFEQMWLEGGGGGGGGGRGGGAWPCRVFEKAEETQMTFTL